MIFSYQTFRHARIIKVMKNKYQQVFNTKIIAFILLKFSRQAFVSYLVQGLTCLNSNNLNLNLTYASTLNYLQGLHSRFFNIEATSQFSKKPNTGFSRFVRYIYFNKTYVSFVIERKKILSC